MQEAHAAEAPQSGGSFSHARYHTFFEHAPLGILYADAESTYIDANPRICEMLGYTRAELIGMHARDIVCAEELEYLPDAIAEIHGPQRHERLWRFRRKDGTTFEGEVVATKFPDGTLLGMIRDVSLEREHEYELGRISRLYAALSQVNQAIVWTSTPGELFEKVCHALVTFGGFRMAWIGGEDAASRRMVPLAHSNGHAEYLEHIIFLHDGETPELWVPGKAFHSGSPVICNDVGAELGESPWRQEMLARGFLAAAAFPIRRGGKVVSVLSVHADRVGFFQHREVALLEEAAADISFALENFAREEARCQAERAVYSEKQFSETMIESMPGILYFYDSRGSFLRWNQNFERVTGYSHEEIGRMHPLDFFGEADRALLTERINEVFERGESAVEAPFLAKDGTTTPYYFTGRRLLYQDRPCLVGVGIDISERVQAEQALREAEVRFHTLFEQTPVGVVVVDPHDASIVECNEQAARQLGYTVEELCRLSIPDIEAIETARDVKKHIQDILRDGQGQFTTRHRAKSGELREIVVTARVLELSGKSFLYGVFFDTTQQKRAERLLRESEAHLQEAQRIAKMGSWSLDLTTRKLKWSTQVFEIFGVSSDTFEASYEAFLGFVHPDDRARLERAQQAALSGSTRLDIEHRIVLADGTEKIVHELAYLHYDRTGTPTYLAGTVHDITDRVRAEAEREARYRAEAADRIKSAFLATMSHELRTPLNSIIGFTGILLQGLAGPLNEEQDKQLEMVRSSARHLLALVNDVLDISKIESGQLEITHAPFDVLASIEKVAGLVRPQVQSKQLELSLKLAPGIGTAIGDSRRFEQILLNLFSNAVKFTVSGTITLRARIVRQPAESGDVVEDLLELEVEDTGMGIRKEDMALLFQPFRQIDSGLTRQHEGTGLGLAICHRLASLMGGTISVESEWGKGSTFQVLLPLNGRANQ